MNLSTPLENIKGVGKKTAELFQAANLFTVEDLIYFLPRKYEDYSEITAIKDIKPGKVTIKAKLENVRTRRVRRSLHITEAVATDETGKVAVVWFNQPYRAKQVQQDEVFYLSGEFAFQNRKYQILNPGTEKVSEVQVQTGRILPIYREIKGLKSHILRKVLSEIQPVIVMLPETMPEQIVKEKKLCSRADSLMWLHFPESAGQLEQAKKRFAFEELFALTLASAYNKQENAKLKGWHVDFYEADAKAFAKSLPFKLTNAQRKAVWKIINNFQESSPMNRLLQGDVGSGKTVVAGMAAAMAARQGYQTAIMAPTEILATQHAETLKSLLEPFAIEVALLTGATPKKAKTELYKHIKTGQAQIIVGTHALIQDAVSFYKLGFVVVDEQHRFGVKQRQQLLHKSKYMPHLLTMTATPIPRSLALTVYGDLAISILDEKPKGRSPIKTKIWSPNSRASLYAPIDEQIKSGRQVYIVCPLIDENPDNEFRSVETEYKRLQGSVFKHRRIGLLHGQLKPSEKEKVMQQFSHGELDILVSTTVIEVGVDVPNATVMLIEGADKFGLAQLHQLRGRVGRSAHQSYCYLVPSTSAAPSKRLRELERSNDGFYLAEVDLELRGPGEIYGKAQHGQLNLKVATLADTKLLASAKDAAEQFIKNKYNLLQYKRLKSQVEQYQRITTLN